MSKLIYREPNGNWGVKGVPWAEIPDGLYTASRANPARQRA